jgi:NADH-quinone oxidoreductase subunit E
MSSNTADNDWLENLIAAYGHSRGNLIPILQDIQDRLGYLSEEAVDSAARFTGISANEIYGVATFYTQFRFTPPADHTIHVCRGTACHVRGSAKNMSELQHLLGIKEGEMTPDRRFELQRVACLGCCALAPVVSIDGKVSARVTPKSIGAVLAEYQNEQG